MSFCFSKGSFFMNIFFSLTREKHWYKKGKLSGKSHPKVQAENIGDGRYGRCSQIGLCDQTDPQ